MTMFSRSMGEYTQDNVLILTTLVNPGSLQRPLPQTMHSTSFLRGVHSDSPTESPATPEPPFSVIVHETTIACLQHSLLKDGTEESFMPWYLEVSEYWPKPTTDYGSEDLEADRYLAWVHWEGSHSI